MLFSLFIVFFEAEFYREGVQAVYRFAPYGAGRPFLGDTCFDGAHSFGVKFLVTGRFSNLDFSR